MIHLPEIWDIIQANMPRGRWVPLQEVYQIVERHGDLDDEDFEPEAPGSKSPKWKRNVRNVLQYRKGTGEIHWDGDGRYFLP